MAIKYYIKYNDIAGVEHRLNIYDDSLAPGTTSIQVDGRIFLSYSETDNPLEAIRGQGLRVELEANENLTFEDLWSDEEKTYQVEYKRAGVILFQGWLNPEGFYEDFVNTDWIVSFDCVDGLGYLSDLSFVDSLGFPITGKKTYLQLLSIALQRTGLNLNINIDIQIRYQPLIPSNDVMNFVLANTERYIKDDGETIMSCEEVIRDVLEPFGACLTSFNGEWYIYKPNQLFLNQTATFYKYDYLGIIDADSPETMDMSQSIRSDINSGFASTDIVHCSGNQRMSNKSSLGAYRVNYKYGLANIVNENPDLFIEVNNLIDGYTIINNFKMDALVAGDYGVTYTIDKINNFPYFSFYTDEIGLGVGYSVDVIINFTKIFDEAYIEYISYHKTVNQVYLVISDKPDWDDATATKQYMHQETGEWTSVAASIFYITSELQVEYSVTTPPVPESYVDGAYFFIMVATPLLEWTFPFSNPEVNFTYNSIKIKPSSSAGQTALLKGEFHTFQRTTKPSAKVENVVKVATGDNVADLYEGTLYQWDTLDPTVQWKRVDDTEFKPLLQIMGEEVMRMSANPARIFSGDVFGFYNYLSVLEISGVSGLFMPIKYEYDTKNNVIAAELIQIYGDALDDETDDDFYEKTYDYGNTVKPTIKG